MLSLTDLNMFNGKVYYFIVCSPVPRQSIVIVAFPLHSEVVPVEGRGVQSPRPSTRATCRGHSHMMYTLAYGSV